VEPLRLTLEGDGEDLNLSVAELASGAILGRGAVPDAERAARCRSGRLHGSRGSVDLGEIEVRPGAGGEVTVEVRDLEARGRAWALWDDGRELPAPALTSLGRDPGPVPGRGHYTEQARRKRLKWLRAGTGSDLATLASSRLEAEGLAGNLENFVGSVELPVGLAGPLLFRGERVRGHVVAPLATTEGTLVASTSRGAAAITRSGGIRARAVSQRMVRAPVYAFDDLDAAARFVRWVGDQLEGLREQVRTVSRHAHLVEVEPWQVGSLVYLRFVYETGDAAGQNMTTIATWQATRWINEAVECVPGLSIRYFAIEGNASGDKKASFVNFLGGRGIRVTAECFLTRETIRDVLKSTPEAMEYGHHLGVAGGLQIGMLGHSINAANVIAAIFAATGQDIACVHESGAAISHVEATPTGLHASMVLPSLVVGTIGGGTALPAQAELLGVLGCDGEGGARRLAEVICGFAVALDLSTGAAVVGGQFADAHERLGRNRPVRGLSLGELSSEVVRPLLAEALDAADLEISAAAPLETGSSIVSAGAGHEVEDRLVGLYALQGRHVGLDGERLVDVVAKVKPLDSEMIIAASKAASLCGGDLAREYARWREWTGAKDAHTRELALYRLRDPRLREVTPRVYGVHEDPAREAYVVVMERLEEETTLVMDAVERPGAWDAEMVDAALTGIAGVHAIWLGRPQELLAEGWLGRYLTASKMAEMRSLWEALLEHNARQFPEWVDAATAARLRRAVAEIERWWPLIEEMPLTLVHNDFNPRNLALRAVDRRLVAYDWELATLHLPQRDLAELLCFTLAPEATAAEVERHLETHRIALEEAAGTALDPDLWRLGYRLALRDFEITRLQLYMMGHTHRELGFLDRLVATGKRLAEIEEKAEREEAARARRRPAVPEGRG
jgi:hydroxymethylglutaryl-CoA reductase (NADPH)